MEHNPYNNDINYPEKVTRYKGPQVPGTGRERVTLSRNEIDQNQFEELGKCGCGCQWVLTGTDYQINQGFYDRYHKKRNKHNIERKSLGLKPRGLE
jgi:hypothetical protein